jgi:hypothetical protein
LTLLEQIAQQRTNDVVYTAVSVTIEKIAAETARAILQEPGFREELKAIALRSLGRTFRDLRAGPSTRPRGKKRGKGRTA